MGCFNIYVLERDIRFRISESPPTLRRSLLDLQDKTTRQYAIALLPTYILSSASLFFSYCLALTSHGVCLPPADKVYVSFNTLRLQTWSQNLVKGKAMSAKRAEALSPAKQAGVFYGSEQVLSYYFLGPRALSLCSIEIERGQEKVSDNNKL